MQHRREVRRCQRQRRNIGAQRHHLHHLGLRAGRPVLGGDLFHLGPPGCGNELFKQIVREVERGQSADPAAAQTMLGVGDQLLSVLYERTIRAAHSGRGTTLSPACGHGIDEQLYLIRQQRIEPHQLALGRLIGPARRLQPHIGGELVTVGLQGFTDDPPTGGGLVEDPLAGDLVDVGREHIDPQREPGLGSGQFDLPGLQAVDHIAEPFLGGDHQPKPAAPLLEGLGHALQVEHPLHRTRDVLARLVHHEHEPLRPRPSALQQLRSPVGEPVGIDVGSVQRPGPLGQTGAAAVDRVQRLHGVALRATV